MSSSDWEGTRRTQDHGFGRVRLEGARYRNVSIVVAGGSRGKDCSLSAPKDVQIA